MGLKVSDLNELILAMGAVIEENKAFLTELDSAIGDADHGINTVSYTHLDVYKRQS